MCGFVGIASTRDAIVPATLLRMRETMKHRGPDAAGIWCSLDGRVGLAHRRLSIIDLSDAAAQPMADGADSLRIVYNGEIYNYRELARELARRGHRFQSASDTEVILEAYRAWGTDCLSHFVGMFAFALYDLRQDRLFLARDRAGEKPLFYWHEGGRLQFASELKALLSHPDTPRMVDREALELYLTCGFVPGSRSMLKGIRKLPPAHALTYDPARDHLELWKYWSPPRPVEGPVEPDALTGELETLLEDAVRGQLIADVPVGILLSGGMDSSLITAMAARVSSLPVRTFTVSLPGHGRYDEAAHARLVADHFGTCHTEIQAEPATVALLPALAAQYDDPLADSSMVPTYLVSRAIRESATVALGGDGGDELFGGYKPYRWIVQQETVRRFVPAGVRRGIGVAVDHLLPIGLKGRNYLVASTADPAHSIANLRVFFDRRSRARLLDGNGTSSMPEEYLATAYPSTATLIQRLTGTDFTTYLPDDILVKVDRAAMLASLEVRAPLLDHRIVEFAFGRVPDALKVTSRGRKILLRRLARRVLPAAFDVDRKQGFSLPLASWFRGEWGEFFREVLAETPADLFQPAEIRRMFAAQRRGLSHMHRLFALTMFELWRRHYQVVT